MNIYWIYFFLIITVIHQSQTLRCRSGNGKLDKSIQKAITKCKHEESNDSSSIDDSSSDENISSDSSIFDDEFFSFNKKNQTNSDILSSQNSRNKNSNNDCNEKSNNYQGNQRFYYTQNANSSKKIDTKLRNSYNDKDQRNNNNNNNNKNTNQSSKGKTQNTNSQRTDHDQHSKSCFFKCLLTELNAINRRGFPERITVTNLLLKDVYDPTVRDLIEEFIIECFHFLQTQMIEDECTFAQYLFECFDNKGRERCDDWTTS
ncbi:general odorant-binding protein 71-like [Chelonus insularis]|uniref:general odorant-binding protein 71-like n=1 Tax=Chelonus insularis TaxID=460826 RepID=UPI00158948ED|nr:general odorant-binding protein 71-like [Chelonus insularis]